VARLVGDQLEQDQPQLALVEDPAPASAAPFVALAPAAVAPGTATAPAVRAGVVPMTVRMAMAVLVASAGVFLKSHSISFSMFYHV
jgi:hypothetical protein